MKKSLITLAALSFAGAASAQSSVTLYGVADIFFGQTEKGAPGKQVKQTVVDTDGASSSRWGFKGSEDLGGGLKANFVLEGGMKMDTGEQKTAGSIFDRVATVGLSGAFGAVTMGRQATPYDALRSSTNNTYDTKALTATDTVWGKDKNYSEVAAYESRLSNSIAFTSANYSGFSGAVAVNFGENKGLGLNNVSVDAGQAVSLHAKYASGPLLVGVAYQEQKTQNAATTAASTGTFSTKYTLIAGSYDFGLAKLTAGYNTAKDDATNAKDKQYQVGVTVPFSKAGSVAFGYAKGDGEIAGKDGKNGSGYSVVGVYDLSKRTTLYAGWMDTKAKNAAGAETYKNSAVAIGVRHKF
ncbi:MAG: porin [Polaromonas sp.]